MKFIVKAAVQVPDLNQQIALLLNRAQSLKLDLTHQTGVLESNKRVADQTNLDINSFAEEKHELGETYEFFAEFEVCSFLFLITKAFLNDFSGFIDAKIPFLDRIDSDIIAADPLNHGEILSRMDDFYLDVFNAFHTLDHILLRYFTPWFTRYSDTWEAAYVDLSVADCAEVYVRVELVGWNPWRGETRLLEDMAWHSSLLSTGFCGGGVFKRVVERFVVPYIVGSLALFDVREQGTGKALASVVGDLKEYIDQVELEVSFCRD